MVIQDFLFEHFKLTQNYNSAFYMKFHSFCLLGNGSLTNKSYEKVILLGFTDQYKLIATKPSP